MKKKLLSLLLAAVMALAVLPALAEADALTLTDMLGRTVTLAGPATRVVVLMPSDCEILYAIGAGDAVVGRGTYCNYPAEAADIPEVNSGNETNLEQILALEPQVVVMTKMAQTEEQVAALENAGVAVLITDAQSIADTYDCITLLGALTGKTEGAAAVIADMQARLAAVAEQAQAAGKTVYFETTPLEYGWGLWSAGSGTFMDEIGQLCGLTNIFADQEGWPMVSEEEVIAADPDYIVTIEMYYGEGPTPVEVIASREGWKGMQAIRNGAIFNADNDQITRPGPRLADAAEALLQFVLDLDAAQEPAA